MAAAAWLGAYNSKNGRISADCARPRNDLKEGCYAHCSMNSAKVASFGCQTDMDVRMVEMYINTLRDSFRSIFTGQMSTLSFGELYHLVYRLSIAKRGPIVHNLMQETVARHARDAESLDEFRLRVKALGDVCMFLQRLHPTLPSAEDIATIELAKRKHLALDHVRRIAHHVGKLRMFFMRLYTHVQYKPLGRGAESAKAEFDSVAKMCSWNGRDG